LLSIIGIISFIEISGLIKKAQDLLEYKTLNIANEVAQFLEQRDQDILLLSKQDVDRKLLEKFYNKKIVLFMFPQNIFMMKQPRHGFLKK